MMTFMHQGRETRKRESPKKSKKRRKIPAQERYENCSRAESFPGFQVRDICAPQEDFEFACNHLSCIFSQVSSLQNLSPPLLPLSPGLIRPFPTLPSPLPGPRWPLVFRSEDFFRFFCRLFFRFIFRNVNAYFARKYQYVCVVAQLRNCNYTIIRLNLKPVFLICVRVYDCTLLKTLFA